jgi:hypothetical protein
VRWITVVPSGAGGDGGPGGPGGHGGGGAGGNSIGILHLTGGSSTTESTTFTTGNAGAGGSSLGNPGSDGVAAETYDADLASIPIQPTCSPNCPPFSTHARLFTDGDSAASAAVLIASENGLEPASSVSIVSEPSHGSASASGGALLSYTPGPDFSDVDAFEYNVCRATGGCRNGFAVIELPEPRVALALAASSLLIAVLHAGRTPRAKKSSDTSSIVRSARWVGRGALAGLRPRRRSGSHPCDYREADGVPRRSPATLRSSSTSGQWIPAPSPRISKWRRCSGVARSRRGNHARGVAIRRPSARTTISSSSVSAISLARGSLLGDEELTPGLLESRSVFLDEPLNPANLVSGESGGRC